MLSKTVNSLKGFYRVISLPCSEASRLISRSMDESLPWRERWALRIHLWICRLCRRYRKQLSVVRQALRRLPERMGSPSAGSGLPDASRTRIKQALRASSSARHGRNQSS